MRKFRKNTVVLLSLSRRIWKRQRLPPDEQPGGVSYSRQQRRNQLFQFLLFMVSEKSERKREKGTEKRRKV